MVKNTEIRNYIRKQRLKQWEVALELRVSEQTLIRWLRTDLPEDKKSAIMAAIDKLAADKED